MPFTVRDLHDLIRLLEQHPEWRGELRRLLLTEEVLGLPAAIRELADGQQALRDGQRALESAVLELKEAVLELQAGQRELREAVLELQAGQRELREAVLELQAGHRALERAVLELKEAVLELQAGHRLLQLEVSRLGTDVAALKGSDAERRYRERGYAYFQRIVERAHVLTGDEVNELLSGLLTAGRLSQREVDELYGADLIVRGNRRPDGQPVYLVVEVSWGIGLADVERAADRAALLTRGERPAIPVVAGDRITDEARAEAERRGVRQVLDGRADPPAPS